VDLDGDGYGSGVPTAPSCTPPGTGYVGDAPGIDCNDGDDTVHPQADDVCGDGLDANCDGLDCVVCTEVVVAVVPGWGNVANYALAFTTLNADASAYGDCPLRFVDVPAGFVVDDLVASGADLVWINDPAGATLQYAQGEMDAIREFAEGGYGGVVVTFLLSYTTYAVADDSALADLVGVDPAAITGQSEVVTSGLVDVLDAGHPLMAGLPSPFAAQNYAQAQGTASGWPAALLPGAEIVAQSADELQVVVAYDDAWRGAWVSTFPEYSVADDATYQLLYNLAFWAGGYGQ
jgi:hypothetical protein